MNKKDKKKLKELFYAFYCKILELYVKKNPKCGSSDVKSFKTNKNGYKISGKIKIHLLSSSYYFDNKKEIQALKSFKDIVAFIKKTPEILKTDSVCSDSADKKNIGKRMYEISSIENTYGSYIYLVAKELFLEDRIDNEHAVALLGIVPADKEKHHVG